MTTSYTVELHDRRVPQDDREISAKSRREAADKFVKDKGISRVEAENMTVYVYKTGEENMGDAEEFDAAEFV